MTDKEVYELMDWQWPQDDTNPAGLLARVRRVIAAEREACAAIADVRAMRCEAKAAAAEDDDEVTELRALAWQFSVLAAEIRNRPNPSLEIAIRDRETERLRAAIAWALGEGPDNNGKGFEPDDDEPRRPDGNPIARYWWRGNLRRMIMPGGTR